MVEIIAKETEKKKAEEAYFITTKELAEAGRDNIPEELISSKHLIYSSPATLAYNSPGAQGFGVKRGLFSNEAGSGSAPCAAAAAECDTPVKAGLTQALGVFIDTIVICSCTAMIMLTAPENIVAGKEGMDLLQSAMRYHLGDFGVIFIAVTLFLFSFSTFLGILFYARSNVAYLFGDNWISQTMYKVLALVMLFVGGIAAYIFVWDLGDVGIGLMTIFNTGILYLMGGQAIKELRVFEESNKAKSNSQCSQQGDNVTQ